MTASQTDQLPWSILPAQQHLASQGAHHQAPIPSLEALQSGIDGVDLSQASHPASQEVRKVKALVAGVSQKAGMSHKVATQHSNSGSEVEESCSEAEESGSKSSSSSSKSEAMTKKAQPDRKTSEPEPNASQPISLPEPDSKDSEEEQKTNHCSFAHCMDADFGAQRDKNISKGLK